MLKVDVGCGNAKRPGFIGVDLIEGTDYRCDISVERLPFSDASVEHLFSAHCLEHIPPERLGHVFQEFTRVTADDGMIELWHTHALHRDAYIFDHRTFLTEENYYHICYRYPEHWEPILGNRWVLEEIRYNVDAAVIADLRNRNLDLEFGINYL